ncbi:hypothetical protein A6R68_19422, partial [Neotoma lepida]
PGPLIPAPSLPPNPPPVSPSPALTWEVRGVGGWMTHSVMMQFHNTQPHLPTDRGTEQEATSGPQQLSSLQSQSSNPQLPSLNPTPFPIEGAEREERRVSRLREIDGDLWSRPQELDTRGVSSGDVAPKAVSVPAGCSQWKMLEAATASGEKEVISISIWFSSGGALAGQPPHTSTALKHGSSQSAPLLYLRPSLCDPGPAPACLPTKTFRSYLPRCHRTYSCVHCRAHLAKHDELISKSFQGSHGRAYLFNSVVNVGCGPAEQRLLLTGLHSVADIFCESCKTTLGWKYEQAFETSQKYKEGKYIIEMSHMVKDNGWD